MLKNTWIEGDGMNINHLKVFQAVCMEGSVTKAAQKLYMSQPTVSHIISGLEEELGVRLFDRISRRVRLNEVGKLFLEKTDRLLELYGQLENSAQELEHTAPLRIGSSITIANFLLPGVLRRFQAQYPDRHVLVTVENAQKVEALLQSGEIDLALVEGAVADERYECIQLPGFLLAAACAPGYPLAQKTPTTPEALAGERLLLREKGSSIRDTFDSAMLLHQLVVQPCWTSVNSQALLAAAREGLGVTILPVRLLERDFREGTLKEIPVEGLRLPCASQAICLTDRYRTQTFRLFLEQLKAFCSEEIVQL